MTVVEDAFGGFAISVEFDQVRVVLGIQGEVDILTAPELGAVLHAIIERRHRIVIVDLSRCDFMDAAGLGVIAHGADRLRKVGGSLALRSPSVMARRLLDISGLAELAGLEHLELVKGGPADPEPAVATTEPPAAASSRLGGEEGREPAGAAGAALPEHLIRRVRRLTAIPSDEDVVDGALRLVVALARATVGGADGVSVSLRRLGHLSTVAASDQTILDMDAGQYATGEGPCVDASVEGRWFHIASMASETRWPDFVPRARELGINAILSSPLLASRQPVGALNIYSRTPSAFRPADQELAAVFADEASKILTDAGIDATMDDLARKLDEALGNRQVIAQAQGVIMARTGIDAERAYTQLRRASVSTGRPLRQEAGAVVDSAIAPIAPPSARPAEDHG